MSLSPDVEDILEAGDLVRLDLIRFELDGDPYGYHRGGRPFTYNGLTYLPNRYLDIGEANQALGIEVTRRTIRFSDVPSADVDDAIARLEEFAYPNALVIITHIAGLPGSNEVVGILTSTVYEIDDVRYLRGAADGDGERTLSIEIDVEPPGRSARGSTHARRSHVEHRDDNDPADTALEYVALGGTEVEEWGQVIV